MFNAVLIDADLTTDHKIVDLEEIDDVIEDVLDGLKGWVKSRKMNAASFSITIRDIHAGHVVSVLYGCVKSGLITVLTDDNRFRQYPLQMILEKACPSLS